MRKLHALVLAVCALSLPVALLSACSGNQQTDAQETSAYRLAQEGKLAFTASLHNTPFEDKTGYEPEGFAVELAQTVAQSMGLEAEFTASKKPEALVAGVQEDGDADIIVASNSEFQNLSDASVTYTESYLDYKLAMAVNKKDKYKDLDELAGKKIGVMKGSKAEEYALELKEDWAKSKTKGASKTSVCVYDTTADAMSDLQARNIDGVVAEEPVLKYYTRVMYYREEILAEGLGEQNSYAFAVASSNQELVAAVNTALETLKSSGVYQEIYDSWFNVDEVVTNPTDPITPPQDQSTYLKGSE